MKRFSFKDYMRQFFDVPVRKLPVDAGFTCPNRDGTLGRGGCTFCLHPAFVPAYCQPALTIEAQLTQAKQFFAAKAAGESVAYLAYFQAYSNTYAAVETLRERYEAAWRVEGVRGLMIATRPDCLSDEVVALLQSYQSRGFVGVELGVESLYDEALERVHRGHMVACSRDAVLRLHRAGIPVGIHLILGLPGVTRAADLAQVDIVNQWPITMLKLHQLQIFRGTKMAADYQRSPHQFHLYTPEEYVEMAAAWLRRLRPDIIVDRLVSEAPSKWLVAPKWGWKPIQVEQRVERLLRQLETERFLQ